MFVCSHSRTVELGRLDESQQYIIALRASKQFHQLSRTDFYTIAGWNSKNRSLSPKTYIILRHRLVVCADGDVNVWSCKCEEGLDGDIFLNNLPGKVLDTCGDIREQLSVTASCIHCEVAKLLFPGEPNTDYNPEDVCNVDTLRIDPLAVAVYCNEEHYYGIVRKRQVDGNNVLLCATCHSRNRYCQHVNSYKDWCTAQNVNLGLGPVTDWVAAEDQSTAISTKPIPLQLPIHLRRKFYGIESGKLPFPECIAPTRTDSEGDYIFTMLQYRLII